MTYYPETQQDTTPSVLTTIQICMGRPAASIKGDLKQMEENGR